MDDIIKIFVALLLGGFLGAERGRAGKPAGLRTYMLVTIAATAFTIISKEANGYLNYANYDPSRIMSEILLGIGFIGGGIIIYEKEHVRGLTTATGLWIATAIGMFVGIGNFLLALLLTFLSFVVLEFFLRVEEKFEKKDNR